MSNLGYMRFQSDSNVFSRNAPTTIFSQVNQEYTFHGLVQLLESGTFDVPVRFIRPQHLKLRCLGAPGLECRSRSFFNIFLRLLPEFLYDFLDMYHGLLGPIVQCGE